MLMLPVRILTTIVVALFVSSRLFRRALAGLAVSAIIVAAQHGGIGNALAAVDRPDFAAALLSLAGLVPG